MALSDPQSITIGSAISLARTSTGLTSAEYRSADGNTVLTVSHTRFLKKGTREPRIRTTIKVTVRTVAADPLTSENFYTDSTDYLTFDRPEIGFTETALINQFTGLSGLLTANTNAVLKKILATES